MALDLIDDEKRITEYEEIHKNVWPEILEAMKENGITNMELYRTGDRLFMIMETTDDFSFEAMAERDNKNPVVQKWENFMWTFQKPLPWAAPGEKWVLMRKIFSLVDSE